jgi:hypothetical protein
MRAHLEEQAENNEEAWGTVVKENGSCMSQGTDRHYSLRRFLATTESVFSGSPPQPPEPSMIRDEGLSLPPLSILPLPTLPSAAPDHMFEGIRSQLGSKSGQDDLEDEIISSDLLPPERMNEKRDPDEKIEELEETSAE